MPIPTTKEALDDLGKELVRIIDLGERERSAGGYEERVKANQADYENRAPNFSISFLKGWRTLHFPLSQPKLDQLAAICLTTIFGQNPVFIAGLAGSDTDRQSRLQRQLQFFVEDHLEDCVDTLLPIVFYAGLGIVAIDFEAVAANQIAVVPPGRVPSASEVAYAGPVYTPIHPLDFGIWPASTSGIRTCQACWHRTYKQERQVRLLQKIGRYLKDDRPFSGNDHPAQSNDPGMDYSGGGKNAEVDSEKPEENAIELRSIQFRQDFGEGEKWYIATIAYRDKRVLRVKALNRSRPGYVDIRNFPVEVGNFWPSRSLGSDLSSLQYQYTYIQNILTAGSAMNAFPMWVTDGAADKIANWQPNTAVNIPGATNTQQAKMGFDIGAFGLMVQQIERQADAVTRITQEQTGVAVAKQQTKAEFQGRQAGAQPGLTKFIQNIGRGLSEIASITQELLTAYYSLWTVAYPDQTFVKGGPDLVAPVKWNIQGKTAEDIPAIRIQKIQQGYALAVQSTQRRAAMRQMPLFSLDALELAFMNDLGLPNVGEIIVDQSRANLGQVLPNPGVPPAGTQPQGAPQGPPGFAAA